MNGAWLSHAPEAQNATHMSDPMESSQAIQLTGSETATHPTTGAARG